MNVLITGPIAPPIGGVSIHISRIVDLLNNDINFDFIDESRSHKKAYFNIRSLNFLQYFKKVKDSDILFIHSGKKSLRIFHLFSGKLFGKKIILTLHSLLPGSSKFTCRILGLLYRIANTIIVVNPDIKKKLSLPSKKTLIEEAFIPPVIETEPALSFSIENLITEKKSDGKVIICPMLRV